MSHPANDEFMGMMKEQWEEAREVDDYDEMLRIEETLRENGFSREAGHLAELRNVEYKQDDTEL